MVVAKEETTIMLVDDSSCFRLIAGEMLKEMGIDRVVSAVDGVEALSQLRTVTFSLIISDYQMAKLTGLDLLAVVQADTELQMIPFVMISASEDPQLFQRARTLGAIGCLSRPLHFEMFSRMVSGILEGQVNRS